MVLLTDRLTSRTGISDTGSGVGMEGQNHYKQCVAAKEVFGMEIQGGRRSRLSARGLCFWVVLLAGKTLGFLSRHTSSI